MKKKIEVIRSILERVKNKKAVNEIASLFEVERTMVLLVINGKGQRQSVKTPIVSLHYVFNPSFNEYLKLNESFQAVFNMSSKSWSIVINDDNKSLLDSVVLGYFRVVVYVNNGLIEVKISEQEKCGTIRSGAFRGLPFTIPCTQTEIRQSLATCRPLDDFEDSVFYVHDGNKFIRFSFEIFLTESPFLLIRYAPNGGGPRYVVYSAIAKVIESVSFGNQSKATATMIARYKDSCQINKIKPILLDQYKQIPITDEKLQLSHGFSLFPESIALARSRTPDIEFFLLCSDYVSVVERGYGADSLENNIAAYVNMDAKKSDLYNKIGNFFSKNSKGFPIIYTRETLSEYHDDDGRFLDTLAHEIAHWLVHENISIYHDCSSHGVLWAFFADTLSCIYLGEYCWSHGKDYFDNKAVLELLENVFVKVAMPIISEKNEFESFSKNEVIEIVKRCLEKFDIALEHY
jgi:hypothetical protein